METQKFIRPKGKILVVADYREKEVIENLKRIGAVVNESCLVIGDFVASDRVVIERKTHSDFIGSIVDGRIFEQAKNLKDNFEKPIVLIEGYSNREMNENALKAALATLLTKFNLSILSTRNPSDTAKTIYWLAKKEQEEDGREVSVKVGKKPRSLREQQEFILCSIPGISTINARKLLNHFKSVEKMMNANEEELRNAGIGKKLSEKVRKVLAAKID